MPLFTLRLLALSLLPLLAACSSTTLNSSWKSPEYQGQVSKVYIIGVTKQETNRRIFEDEFGRELQKRGAVGISSYRDLSVLDGVQKEAVAEQMQKNGADSVLLVRLLKKRSETVVNPGRATGTTYYTASSYSTWGGYYDSRYVMIYEPPTVTRYEVAMLEANLYNLEGGELIWSAQLDVMLEPNLQKLVGDFVDAVIDDLVANKLL